MELELWKLKMVNDNRVVKVLEEVGEEILSKDCIKYKEFPSMGADDFAFFLEEIPGAYYYLGSGNKEKGWTAPIHNENFMVDEECIKVGVHMQVKTIIGLIKSDIND